jgi:hypothetical protein
MDVSTIFVVVGLVAGFAKFCIDFADRFEKRIDKIENDIITLSHDVKSNHREQFFNSEVIESRLNLMLSTQNTFKDMIVCRYKDLEEKLEK